jgi:hypothetical protein
VVVILPIVPNVTLGAVGVVVTAKFAVAVVELSLMTIVQVFAPTVRLNVALVFELTEIPERLGLAQPVALDIENSGDGSMLHSVPPLPVAVIAYVLLGEPEFCSIANPACDTVNTELIESVVSVTVVDPVVPAVVTLTISVVALVFDVLDKVAGLLTVNGVLPVQAVLLPVQPTAIGPL